MAARFAQPNEQYLAYFTDDFFYYAVVARNVARYGVSTFNGLQITNGYHPLWQMVLAAVAGLVGTDQVFFVVTTAVIWLLVALLCLCLCKVARRCAEHAPASLVVFATLFSTLFAAVLARTGMEISLALVLLTALYWRLVARPLETQSTSEVFASGMLASFAVLARIDAIIAVGIYLTLYGLRHGASLQLAKTVAWFSLGGFLVPAYVWTNHHWFDVLLPISGVAKNLKAGFAPSMSTVERFLRPDEINVLFAWPSLAVAVFYLIRRAKSELEPIARVQLTACLHPLVFYLALSVSSDWPIWPWYLYPMVPLVALLLPRAVAGLSDAGLAKLADWLLPTLGVAGGLICWQLAKPHPPAVAILEAAQHLRSFAKSHPGVYAMGDRAGTPAFVLGNPVIQLEGLMGDRAYLDRVKRQEPLLQALQDLGVDYYVTSQAMPASGCLEVREPSKAGRWSPTLRGKICEQPVLAFTVQGRSTSVFRVKDLRSASN